MQKRRLGSSELMVSILGLGCNNFGWRTDGPTSATIVDAALDAGINFFDTADVYGRHGGSETLLGEMLGSRREKVLIASKFGAPMSQTEAWQGASPAYIALAVEASLKRLKTDWIDLYQLHWPDPDVPMAETLGALQKLVEAGKVRAVGCCNLSAGQLAEAIAVARQTGFGFVSAQLEYSLVARDIEADTLPLIEASCLSLIPYFPLASGLLAGNGKAGPATGSRLAESQRHAERFLTRERLAEVEKLRKLARKHDISLLQLALGWLARRRCVASIIAGASSPGQVLANVAAIAELGQDFTWLPALAPRGR